MRHQHDPRARLIAGLPAAIVTCACLAVTGCGGAAASPAAAGSPGHVTRPATSSSPQAPAAPGTAPGTVHLTGNFCADAAVMSSRIGAVTASIVTNPTGRQQQRTRQLVAAMVATFTALGSEAPAELKAPFAELAGFYQAVGNKLASGGGQLTLASIEPALHPAEASAARQLNSYLVTRCGPA